MLNEHQCSMLWDCKCFKKIYSMAIIWELSTLFAYMKVEANQKSENIIQIEIFRCLISKL